MSAKKGQYALIDYDDGCSKEVHLSFICKPRKNFEEYCVGERIEARYPGMSGTFGGTIAALSADRVWLRQAAQGPRPVVKADQEQECAQKSTVDRKRKHPLTMLPPMPSDRELYETIENDEDQLMDEFEIENVVPKKKPTLGKDLQEGAQSAKKEAAKIKRQKGKIQAEGSSLRSLEVLPDQSMVTKMEQIGLDIAGLKADLKTVNANQEKMMQLMEPFLEAIQCNQCLKSMYKGNKKGSQSVSKSQSRSVSKLTMLPFQSVSKSPTQFLSKLTMSQSQSVSKSPSQSVSKSLSKSPSQSVSKLTPPQSVSKLTPSQSVSKLTPSQSVSKLTPSQSVSNLSMSTSQSVQSDLDLIDMEEYVEEAAEREHTRPHTDPFTDSLEDLEYLGEARYGVQMKRVDLRRCTSQSTTPEKLALNLIEFLVSKEECQDLTVYGHGKLKREMAPNMRRAIKSQIFSLFMKDRSDEEKQQYWNEKIVYKMNDKIRGIKNGKNKSKKI